MATPLDPLENKSSGNDVSPDVKQAVEEAQIFIAYIAWKANLEIDESILQVIIDSKYRIKEGKWSPEAELQFWLNFDKLAEQVGDVTIESLKATLPGIGKSEGDAKAGSTNAVRAVSHYRRLAYIALIFLLMFQVYWFIGKDLTTTIHTISGSIAAIEKQTQQIRSVLPNNTEVSPNYQSLIQLEDESHELIRRLNANYNLLQYWNRIWLFNQQFEGRIKEYTKEKYEVQQTRIKEKALATQDDVANGITTKKVGEPLDQSEIDAKIRDLNLLKDFDKSRNEFFLNQLSAQFILNALQSYLLPLLYGWLGAVIYVLRKLSIEIKEVTYSSHSDIRFRLRISVGPLGGMIIGWFFTPEQGNALASLGPLTVAFLTGYNIDILFSLMDKAANSLTNSIQGSAKPKAIGSGGEKPQKTDNSEKPPSPPPVSDEPPSPSPEKTA